MWYCPPPSSPPPPSRHHVGSVIPLVLTGVALEVSALGMVTLKMLGFVLGDGGGGGWGLKFCPQSNVTPMPAKGDHSPAPPVCSQGDGLQRSLGGSELGPCRVPTSCRRG